MAIGVFLLACLGLWACGPESIEKMCDWLKHRSEEVFASGRFTAERSVNTGWGIVVFTTDRREAIAHNVRRREIHSRQRRCVMNSIIVLLVVGVIALLAFAGVRAVGQWWDSRCDCAV